VLHYAELVIISGKKDFISRSFFSQGRLVSRFAECFICSRTHNNANSLLSGIYGKYHVPFTSICHFLEENS
jgi:hypothetical protein